MASETPYWSKVSRRYGWALAASLLLHVALLFSAQFSLPERIEIAPPIEARLEKIQPPPPPVVKASEKLAPKPRPRPVQEPQPVPDPVPERTADPAPAPVEPPKVAEAPRPEPIPVAYPDHAELRFTLFRGEDGLAVGEVMHVLDVNQGIYSLSSTTEASGIFSLFKRGKLIQVSQGRLTARGFKPDTFWIQRGQSVEKSEWAQFDWSGSKILYGTGQSHKAAAMTGEPQDLLSFLYQFAFLVEKHQDLPFTIANGRKVENYAYQVQGEELLETPVGKLKTLKVARMSQPGEDQTEVWLALDKFLWPVKIRHTDKSGDVAIQLISEIK